MKNGFTRTEQAMIEILADGKPHSRAELHTCCGPSCKRAVTAHISNIRKKLPPGQDIVAVMLNRGKAPFYQQIRKLASPYDGRK